MDLVHDRASTIAEEEQDKISKLPDDIIHRILGFLDMKYAIQTSKLSRKWKHIWTSMPHLNLNIHTFGSVSRFAKFVKRALSHRNNGTEVSTVKLTFREESTPFAVKSIVNYAYSHNVRQLMIVWTAWKRPELPQHFFSCHTLKHLTLRYIQEGSLRGFNSHVPKTAWDFPALETLNLSGLRFGDGEDEYKDKSFNLFSKCVNLKDLTLHRCTMSREHIFNVSAPKLLNLSVTNSKSFPKVFNVVTPQLENFTASVMCLYPEDFLPLSTDGLDSLEKVNLSFLWSIDNNNRFIPKLLDLFQKTRSAKFLILDAWIIEALTLYMDQVSHEPCPFNNLKCLKIDKPLDITPILSLIERRDRIAKMAPQVRNYLLENSPGATFIMDLPQLPPVPVKRPRKAVHNNTMTNKLAKLDVHTAPKLPLSNISRQEVHNEATTKKMANLEAVEKQPETISEDKRMLETKIQMQEEVILKQKAMFEVKIQMQDKFIAKQAAVFLAKIERQDKVIVEQMEKIQMQDEAIAKQKAIFEAKTQMVEAAKLQHEQLMSLIIKSKITELKVKIESGNPDHEVICSTGIDLKSVMDLIPESLRVNLEARFFSLYEGFKSLFLTRIDDSQWAKIETELEKEYKGFLD